MEETTDKSTVILSPSDEKNKLRVFKSLRKYGVHTPKVESIIAKNLVLKTAFVKACIDEYLHTQAVPGDSMDFRDLVLEIDIHEIIKDKVDNVLEKWPDRVWPDDGFKTQVCNVTSYKWRSYSEDDRWKEYRVKAKKYNLWAARNTAARLRQIIGKI